MDILVCDNCKVNFNRSKGFYMLGLKCCSNKCIKESIKTVEKPRAQNDQRITTRHDYGGCC